MEYQENYSLGEELCTNEDIPSLHFDDSEYLSLDSFCAQLYKLLSARRGKGCYKAYTPIQGLRVNGRVAMEPMDKYLETDAVCSSLVKECMISPRHYWIKKNAPIEPRDDSFFKLGTFAHSAILEPSKFKKVHKKPEANKISKDGCIELIKYYTNISGLPNFDFSKLGIKDLRLEVSALEGFCDDRGHSFVDSYDARIVNIMKSQILTYGGGVIPRIMYYAKKEVSMYGVDPNTGLNVKIRPDAMLLEEDFGANIIVSVKTTSEVDPPAFDRDCARRRYEVAEGMYLDVASNITGRKFSGVLMIVVQTIPPFQPFLKWWTSEDLQIGKYKYYHTMDTIKESEEKENFPGFETFAAEGNFGIIESKLPEYIKCELPPQYLGR